MNTTTNFGVGKTAAPTEGQTTKQIEQFTAKVPSLGYLGLAVGSMFLSAGIALFSEKKNLANFIGLWVPSIMLVGVYNKLVKLEGSDHLSNPNIH